MNQASKQSISTALKTSLLLISMLAFSACGQKGPLEIERPTTKTQTEEPEETK